MSTAAEKKTKTTVDTVRLTPDLIRSWKHGPFQRTLMINDKVKAVSEKIRRDNGVLPGILTLGLLGRDTYIVDGQHRCEAFLIAGLSEGYADIRYHHFESISEMAREFEELNSSLVAWKPDDILRAKEQYLPALKLLRELCPYIGYTQVRRREGSVLISASAVLRCWFGSEPEVPSAQGSARECAERLTVDDAKAIAAFMELAFDSWGRDYEHFRLWGALTMCLTMWLYRRTVIGLYSPATTRLSREQFGKALQALSADGRHMEFLVGRSLGESSRAPTYNRMKIIIARRLEDEFGRTASGASKVRLPTPAWAHAN